MITWVFALVNPLLVDGLLDGGDDRDADCYPELECLVVNGGLQVQVWEW